MTQNTYTVTGNLVDIINKKIYPAQVEIENNFIKSITLSF